MIVTTAFRAAETCAFDLNPAVGCRAFWSPHSTAVTEYAHGQNTISSDPFSTAVPASVCPGLRHFKGPVRARTLFVSALGASHYTYAQALPGQRTADCVARRVNMCHEVQS